MEPWHWGLVLAPLVAMLWRDSFAPITRWLSRKLPARWQFLLTRIGQ